MSNETVKNEVLEPEAQQVYDAVEEMLEAFGLTWPGDIADALRRLADEYDELAEEVALEQESRMSKHE